MTSYALETVAEIEAKQAAPKVFIAAVSKSKPGTIISADSLAGVAQVDIPQQIGSLYQLPEFRRLVEWAGYAKSKRTGGVISLWRRVETAEEKRTT